MSDKLHTNDNVSRENGEIIYQRNAERAANGPIFKPGATPHTQFGKQVLNANVPWHSVVTDIIKTHYDQVQLARELDAQSILLDKILQQDYSELNFRTGARLLGVHARLFPGMYA